MAQRRRRLLPCALVGLATILAAELGLRALDSRLVEPLVWYDATVQVRLTKLDALVTRGDSPEVIFLGSSSVANGLDPTTFTSADPCRRRAFDAGATGATPQLLERYWHDGVLPRATPDVVVIGLTTRDVAYGAGSTAWEGYITAPATKPGTMADLARFGEERLALVRYRRLLRDPSATWNAVSGHDDRRLVSQRAHRLDEFGFPDHSRDHDYSGIGKFNRRQIDPWRMLDREVAALARLSADLDAAGIDTVFVFMPTSPEWGPAHGNGQADVDRFEATVRDLAAEHDDVVIDLSDAISDTEAFVDAIHLDLEGARAATRLLAAQMPTTECA